jgi:hypothetical protein
VKPKAGGLVGGPQVIPQLGPGVVGLGGHACRRERAVRPAAVGGQRRDERRAPGGVVGVVVARHRDHPPGGVGQVGTEGRVGGAAAGHLDGAAEPADLVEHGQAAAALQDDAVDQRAGQVLPAVAEVETDDGAAQQGVPQRALLAGLR